MRAPDKGAAHRGLDVEESGELTSTCSPDVAQNQVAFLRERYAREIEGGDDITAERLCEQPHRILNTSQAGGGR